MMSKPNPQELAKQGNARAIAAHMNRWLQPKGITTAAQREGSRLKLTLEADRVPNKTVLVTFIRKILASVEAASIQTVNVTVHQTGESSPVWEEEIELTPVVSSPSAAVGVAPPVVFGETASEETVATAPDERVPVGQPIEETAAAIEYDRGDAMSLGEETTSPVLEETAGAMAFVASATAPVSEETVDGVPPGEESVAPVGELRQGAIASASEQRLPEERFSREAGDSMEPDRMEVAEESKPLSWLDTQRGKQLAIASIYSVALLILAIASYRQGTSLIEVSPTPATTSRAEPPAPEANPTPAAQPPDVPGAKETSPADNPFRAAVNQAIAAASLAQTAKSKEDWQTVAAKWQEAIALMQAVPSSNPNYQVAQQKVGEYERNLNYAQRKAASSR